MAPAITLYLDLISQPCRALWLFIKLNNLPVEVVKLRISNGENRSPEMLRLNPTGKLPFLRDGDNFSLVESAAMFTYLLSTGKVADHWFPQTCPKAHARVESLLHWHHANTRAGAAGMVFQRVLLPKWSGKPVNQPVAQQAEVTLKAALAALETVWLSAAAGGTGGPLLSGGGVFLGGLEQVSLADVQVACELEQLVMLDKQRDGVDMAQLLAPHAAVRAWQGRVAAACGEHWAAANNALHRAAAAPKL